MDISEKNAKPNLAANPERMDNFEVAFQTYRAWKKLLEENTKRQKKGKPPAATLCAFLRTDPVRINLD